jgi:glycosidase
MKPVIYQLFVRLFGNRSTATIPNGTIEENGCGTFCDINEQALASLKKMGISHIWYTGIIEHAVAADYSAYGIFNDFPEIIKGRAGSPYAIKNYFNVNPDLATDVHKRMEEFEDLVARTHAAGMKVLIDFVPNHLARVYRSGNRNGSGSGNADFGVFDQTGVAFSAENDFYYLPGEELKLPGELYKKAASTEYRKDPLPYREFPARVTGNDCFSSSPGIGDWYETVKLNYGVDYINNRKTYFNPVPPVWEKMKNIILFWAGKNIDGFRADMAEMVPLEFWEWLIPQIKKQYPEIIFIAEIYQPELYRGYIERGNFDYLYDKADFYDSVRNIIEGKSDTRAITHCWQKIGDLEKYMLRFLENHDEQRIASKYFASDPWKALPGMVLAATMNNGPLLLYSGQETGEPAEGCSGFSGDDGRTSIFDYWKVPNHQKWMNDGAFDGKLLPDDLTELRKNYSYITRLCSEHQLFSNGSFYDLMWVNEDLMNQTSGKIYAYLRYNDNEVSLIILNFGYNKLNDLQLLIPEGAFAAMKLKKDSKAYLHLVYPSGNPDLNVSLIGITEKIKFNISSLSALILFFRKHE